MTDRDEALIGLMRAHWQSSIDGLSGEDLSRLNRARHKALAAQDRPVLIRHLLPTRLLMATVSAMLLLMIGLHLSQSEITSPLQGAPQAVAQQQNAEPDMLEDDYELLAEVESLDLITDLEFYQWLELELDETRTL